MKYAVDRSLASSKYEEEDIGVSLERLLNYWTLKNKFTGVALELDKFGIKRVVVTKEGLQFIR